MKTSEVRNPFVPTARWVRSVLSRLDRAIVLTTVATLLAVMLVTGSRLYGGLRERAFDVLAAWWLPPSSGALFVDIDREALQRIGPWPWSRERLAELVAKVAAAQPRAVALDLVLEGEDTRSPAALARALLERGPVPGLAEANFPDGDKLLAAALARAPTVLALALDPMPGSPSPALRPLLIQGRPALANVWTEPGLIGPPDAFLTSAQGAGVSVMPGDADGNIRRVPLLAVGGGKLAPGLAVEILRVSQGVPLHRLAGATNTLHAGRMPIVFDADAMVRVAPPRHARFDAVTVSAADLLSDDGAARKKLEGRIVVIGSSAPETGGLRPNGAGDLVPGTLFHLAALDQLHTGRIPRRPAWLQRLEATTVAVAGAAGGLVGAVLSPWLVVTTVAATGVLFLAMVAALFSGPYLLVDPIALPLALGAGALTTTLLTAARTRRLQAQMKNRFEQHLAPAVIAQLLADPTALRIEGRERVITALFTDVEGFTSMTERASARDLIAVLDRYFDGMCRIVVAHGGMIDKIVGDAVHAIFNAPLDLPEHPRKAIDCARELAAFAAAYAKEPLPKALGFGRTRIGIETGPAIVGDVGGERKLDYTAHGHAVNAAARLEAVNKQFGTTIAIGPGTAAQVGAESLKRVGQVALRGQEGQQNIFTVPD